MANPYTVIMKPTKLPVTLLNESAKHKRVHLLDTESFQVCSIVKFKTGINCGLECVRS